MIINKDISGVYIILFIALSGLIGDLIYSEDENKDAVDIITATVGIIYLIPILLIILFIQKKKNIKEEKLIYYSTIKYSIWCCFSSCIPNYGFFYIHINKNKK